MESDCPPGSWIIVYHTKDLNQQKKFKDCLKRWILGRPYVLARGMNLFNNGLEYDIGVG